MNKFHLLSLTCFIIGAVFFAVGIFSGEVETGFVLIFPFLIGSGIYAFLGFIFIFIAILFLMFGFTRGTILTEDLKIDGEDENLSIERKTSVKGGGVVLIGPIPIVFGSNWKIAALLMMISIILIITTIFVLKIF